MNVFKRIYFWVDERLEMHEILKKDVLDKPIPKGLNISYCFGGITFFLFVMLAVTGYFMTLYYVPSPEQAYDAVDYLTYEVPLGYVVRGVHHWSANLMIVTIFIHMIRVFVYGAYKNPREINWMTGVCLFCLVMAFGFTGYLLPWDQKAYWATKVGTSIMGTVPVVGEYALRLIRGGENLGALTMTRFYALHVLFLPAATLLFLVGHFVMIRKQYPSFLFKEIFVMMLIFILVVVILSLVFPVGLGDPADPTDNLFLPKPEWYFMSLYELLKYFPGKFEVIATAIIPAGGILVLFLVPFLDKGPEKRPSKRPLAMILMSLALAAILALTLIGILS